MRDALEQAFNNAKKREMVLLSPACASFDEFESYAKRGEQFEKIIKELAHAKN